MPSRYRFRNLFKSRFLVKSFAKLFTKLGLKPNHVTLMMFFFSVLSAFIAILTSKIWLFGIMLFITCVFDGIDGTLARMTDSVTKFGGFLDSIMDRFSEIIIYTGIFLGFRENFIFGYFIFSATIFVAVFFSLLISYTRSRITNEISGDFDIGLFARTERLMALVIISIIPDPRIFSSGLIILAGGIFLTALYRIIKYSGMLRENRSRSRNREAFSKE